MVYGDTRISFRRHLIGRDVWNPQTKQWKRQYLGRDESGALTVVSRADASIFSETEYRSGRIDKELELAKGVLLHPRAVKWEIFDVVVSAREVRPKLDTPTEHDFEKRPLLMDYDQWLEAHQR